MTVRFIAYHKCMTCGRSFHSERAVGVHLAWQARKGVPHRRRTRPPVKVGFDPAKAKVIYDLTIIDSW